jgi:DNA-binding MarR family transcriptional regulator
MTRPPPPVDFYRAHQYSANESIGYLVLRIQRSMNQATGKRMEPHGLTNAQWEPLFRLNKMSGATVAELAREMQIDPGATTRLLDRLEAKGLCKRVRSTEDRRVVNVELTAAGEEAAAKIPSALVDVMNAHLAGFSKTEWQALLGYLRRVLVNGENLLNSGDEK